MQTRRRTITYIRSTSAGLGFAVAALLALPASAAIVDFNTPGDLNKFFGANSSGTTAANFVEADGIGTGSPASRALDSIGAGTGYTTLVYAPESFSLTPVGSSVTVSIFGQKMADISPTDNSSTFLRVGLTNVNNNISGRLTGGTGYAAALDLFPVAGGAATDVQVRYSQKVDASPTFVNMPSGAVTLTTGNWYKLSATFTSTSATTYTISGLLEDYGTNGIAAPTPVLTVPAQTLTNGNLIADTTLYGALLARQDGGSNAVDDFTVVPEPSTALLAVGAAALIGLRRRRRTAGSRL